MDLWRIFLVLGLLGALVVPPESFGADSHSSTNCPSAGDPRVTVVLCATRARHGVPGIAAAVLNSRGITAFGAAGLRKAGADQAVTPDDLWHLGSDTKAMTAALVARMVERGELRWGTTVAEVFPELAETFRPQFRTVNLRHLLSHHAGLEPNLNWARIARHGTVGEQRLAAVKEALTGYPKHAPGTKYLYSNLGYVIVGAMVERVSGRSWEDCMRREIFQPLGMKSAGFGGLGTPGFLDQPWGHRKANQPVAEYGPVADNPPVIGPAGTVHCSLQDWALFIMDQLRGFRGEAGLLRPETYHELARPPFGGDYALGWAVVDRPWAQGKALNHCGCNTMFFANAWIAPERDFAVLVTANLGLPAFEATDEVVQALVNRSWEPASPDR